MPRVTQFEVEAERPEQLARFHEKIFNWKFEKWAGALDYWMIMAGENEPGIDVDY